MRALVLGATVQLGSNLVRALLAKGDEVRAFIRPTSMAITLRGVELEPRNSSWITKVRASSWRT